MLLQVSEIKGVSRETPTVKKTALANEKEAETFPQKTSRQTRWIFLTCRGGGRESHPERGTPENRACAGGPRGGLGIR